MLGSERGSSYNLWLSQGIDSPCLIRITYYWPVWNSPAESSQLVNRKICQRSDCSQVKLVDLKRSPPKIGTSESEKDYMYMYKEVVIIVSRAE